MAPAWIEDLWYARNCASRVDDGARLGGGDRSHRPQPGIESAAASPAGGRHTFLTHAEVEALAVAAGRSRVLILFLANTGLRFGGISALRVGDVDLAARRVAVNRAWAGQNTGESVPVGAEDP